MSSDGTVTEEDGTIDKALANLITEIDKTLEAKGNNVDSKQFSKTEFNNAYTTIKAAIKKVLDNDDISNIVRDSFTVLSEELETLNTEVTNLNDLRAWTTSGNAANANTKSANYEKFETLKEKISSNGSVGKALESANKAVNMQMTSLDELRTTLQGFVAKPNDVNLDHTSFTTFLDAA